jgi:hypothetical protein
VAAHRVEDEDLAPVLGWHQPSFYDPLRPSYLYRSGPLLIHYRGVETGGVEFLNLFFPRPSP